MQTMFANTAKQKLINGGTAVGCLLAYPDSGVAELLGACGFDFILFDGEHGLFEPRDVAESARAVDLRGTTPLVRVSSNRADVILRFLDAGAHGVQVPQLNSGEQAEAAVRSAKYRPLGTRGLSGGRMNDFGLTMPIDDYMQIANEQTLVIGHVESAEGVAHVTEFVSVDGLDVVFIGPVDLSQSLGHPGDLTHPEVVSAIDRVTNVVLDSDKALGIYAPDNDSAIEWMERGARYILTSVDRFVVDGASRYLAGLQVQ